MAEGTRKNPLEYEREYNEFMYKLRRFLASKDMPMKNLPVFGGEEIDLYLLYKTVTNLGGWLKVTDERKWHEVAKCFNLPPSCLNSAFALRQLYVRYLEGYEKLYFLGEDSDDSSFPRLNLYTFGQFGGSSSHPSPAFRDPHRNFERLVLSLQSGLPNEVDFAFNICMLLSNVNNSVFNLAKAPAVVDMMLAHVGVFLEDSYGSSELYKEWYKNSRKDFLKFWKRVLNCEEIKELLPKGETDEVESNNFCAEEIFNLDKTAAHADYELQRVLQVCTILHNFSFDKMDASVLSSHPVCLRFLLLCLHSNIGSLKKLATDTMTNLANKTVLEPLESLNSQLFFFMVDRYVRDSDRYNNICAMNILRRICLLEENHDSICKAIDAETYEALVKVLILQDVQLLMHSLETLYQLTGLGQIPCDHVVAVQRSVDILVSIVNVSVESFSAETLTQVKVVDNYHGTASVAGGVSAKGAPAKVLVNSGDQVQKSEAEAEAFAQHWLRATYDVDSANTVLQRELFADYLTSCGKLSRSGILNSSSFFRTLRSIFPDVQVRKLNTGNQQLHGLVGIRRKVSSEQLHGQTKVSHAPRTQLCRTPTPPLHTTSPVARTATPQMGMETNYVKVGHVPRTPTPPMQREVLRRPDGLITNAPQESPVANQSSSLPGQRYDIIFSNVPSSPHMAHPSITPSALPTQTSSSFMSSVPTNAAQSFQKSEIRNNPVMNIPGNHVGSSLNARNNSGSCHAISPGGPAIPSSTPTLTQPNVCTVAVTGTGNNPTYTPGAGVTIARKADLLPAAVRTPNGTCGITASSKSSTNLQSSGQSAVMSDQSQSRNCYSGVVACSNGPQIVSKGAATVNGSDDYSGLKSKPVVSGSGTIGRLPSVNGPQTNGESVLYVAREEQASKIARKDHEVIISVVENPSKPTVESSDQTVTSTASDEVTVPGRKRSNSAENSNTDPAVNGPYVASEMLRSVAKRQRCDSEGGTSPLVNGVASGNSEQKDPVAWDEVSTPHQKSVVTSPKLPIAVNGVRLDLISQHAQLTGSKTDYQSNVVNNLHVKTNAVFPGYNIPGNVTNAVVAQSASSVISNSSAGSTVFSPVMPQNSVVIASRGQTTGAQAVVLNRNVVGTTSSTLVASARSDVTEDNSRNAGVRGHQAPGGACGPYRCMWNGCGCSFVNSKLLYNHAVSVHAPANQLFTYCQWEGCSNVRRSRASLLFHLRQKHLSPTQPLLTKDSNSLPKPQKTPTLGPVPPPQPAAAPAFSRQVYPPHPSVNPLLMSLKEQLLQTEQETPLTKSIRLTAALILRNIAKYSPTGRRKLKRFESSFTDIMCSKLESNGAIAACLHEMTRRRQENVTVPKR